MTETTTEATTEEHSTQSSGGWFRGLLVLIFRLLLLGVGSVFAVLLGVAIATMYSAEVSNTPVLETALKRSLNLRRALQQSPGAALDELLEQGSGSPAEEPTDSEIDSDSSIEATSEVDQTNNALRITLPSDVLFEDRSSALVSGNQPIFDNVVQEIQRYPGATVQVAAYSDRAATVARNRQTAFEQAQVVQQSLASDLAEDLYHWVTIGYGKDVQSSDSVASESSSSNQPGLSQPESAESSLDSSENGEPPYRRVEISIILE